MKCARGHRSSQRARAPRSETRVGRCSDSELLPRAAGGRTSGDVVAPNRERTPRPWPSPDREVRLALPTRRPRRRGWGSVARYRSATVAGLHGLPWIHESDTKTARLRPARAGERTAHRDPGPQRAAHATPQPLAAQARRAGVFCDSLRSGCKPPPLRSHPAIAALEARKKCAADSRLHCRINIS